MDMSPKTMAEAQARIAELEEEVRQLKAFRFGGEDLAPLPDGVKLSRLQWRIWSVFWRRRKALWGREALIEAVYWGSDAVPESKSLDVILHKMRRRLSPHGVVIETVWGQGWRLVAWPAALEAV